MGLETSRNQKSFLSSLFFLCLLYEAPDLDTLQVPCEAAWKSFIAGVPVGARL